MVLPRRLAVTGAPRFKPAPRLLPGGRLGLGTPRSAACLPLPGTWVATDMEPRTGGWLAGLKPVHLARDNGCGVGVAFPACAYIEDRGESCPSGSHVSSQNGLPPP